MAILSEVGDQTVPAPCGGASQGAPGGVPLFMCVADSTVVTDGANEAVLDSTSGSESEEDSGDDDVVECVEESIGNDVTPSVASTPSLPSLQGRLICLSDYLPNNEMPDISFSNPENFWYMSS